MFNLYDVAYGLGGAVYAGVSLVRPKARRKVLDALKQRMGEMPRREGDRPAVLIHAVSLGEINATPELVKLLRGARPELEVIISATTQTGFARAGQLYGADSGVEVVRFPLDFSGAVGRLLDGARPTLVVLMELELWPNFLRQCFKRDIPVVLVNGRMTPSAFKRYRLIKPVAKSMLRQLAVICAQDDVYAGRFIELGAVAEQVKVTGTMKFDTAQVVDAVPGADLLAGEVGLVGAKPIWVCGSTGPGEEQIILAAYRSLLKKFAALRLVIVPRKPERFDEVAKLIESEGFPVLRRSSGLGTGPESHSVILGDTMGELRKFYSLADVVLVGRTLVDLGSRQHGSDMIEPAALGKPIVVGPWTHNFAEAMRVFREGRGIVEIRGGEELAGAIEALLNAPDEAAAMGARGREVVRGNQGATGRHAEVILGWLERRNATLNAQRSTLNAQV